MDNLRVIVGAGIGGQREIMDAVSEAGFDVKGAGRTMWPRDKYVYFRRYVKSRLTGRGGSNAFGIGGNILTGDNFLLVSDTAYLYNPNKLPKSPSYEQIKETIIADGRRQYPEARIHIAPTGYYHGGKRHEHIDMYCLLIPERRLLLLDTHYGWHARDAKGYDEIAEQERLRLVRYDGSIDNCWNPLNALNLPGNVVLDSGAKSLIKLLRDEGLRTIGVEMPQKPYPAGKIRCQTNTYNPNDVDINDLFDSNRS